MRRFFAVLGLLAALLASPVRAANVGPGNGPHDFYSIGRIFNAVACNAAAGARTWTSTAGTFSGYGLIGFQFDFTRVAATWVSWTCEGTYNDGTSWAYAQSCSVAAGVCTSTDASWTKDVSGGSKNFIVRVDFLGASDIRCVWSCTAGGATDLVTAYARAQAQ
jgi:hypothetical protein